MSALGDPDNFNKNHVRCLRQEKKYVPEYEKEIYVCCYFDPVNKKCMIYENRPICCRNYNCKVWIDAEAYSEEFITKNKEFKKKTLIKNKIRDGKQLSNLNVHGKVFKGTL